ncbi:unnamed protein product, partial [Ixodes pacificus]
MLVAMPHRGQTLVNGLHKRLDSLLDTLPSTEAVTKLLRDWNEQLDSNTASARLCEVSPSGLVSITGGTWTWYRLLAERAVDAASASCDDKLTSWTTTGTRPCTWPAWPPTPARAPDRSTLEKGCCRGCLT